MLLPSEVEAKQLVPIMRALVAKQLVKQHKFSQMKAAKMLGITQAAVSNYIRSTRGADEDFANVVAVRAESWKLASLLASGANEKTFISAFNSTCEQLKKQRLMCDLHKRAEPSLDIDGCQICAPIQIGTNQSSNMS